MILTHSLEQNTLFHDGLIKFSYPRLLGMQSMSLEDNLATKFYFFSTLQYYISFHNDGIQIFCKMFSRNEH